MQIDKPRINKWKVAAIILIVLLVGYFILASYTLTKTRINRDYYKDQMLNFCEASKILKNLTMEADPSQIGFLSTIFPEECSFWVLPGESP